MLGSGGRGASKTVGTSDLTRLPFGGKRGEDRQFNKIQETEDSGSTRPRSGGFREGSWGKSYRRRDAEKENVLVVGRGQGREKRRKNRVGRIWLSHVAGAGAGLTRTLSFPLFLVLLEKPPQNSGKES